MRMKGFSVIKNYFHFFVILALCNSACGISKFQSIVDKDQPNSNPTSNQDIVSSQQEAVETNIQTESKDESSDLKASDNTPDYASELSSDVWIVSWNTDDYVDADCLMLTQGIAVTKKNCLEKLPVVCETSCQASAQSPQDCNQVKYQFVGINEKMVYADATQVCSDKGLVLLHYHISKVNEFKSQAGL